MSSTGKSAYLIETSAQRKSVTKLEHWREHFGNEFMLNGLFYVQEVMS